MARASIWLTPFDRDADYVVAKPFVAGGVMLRPGDPFDKTTVSVRRHRQLYEQRRVAKAPMRPPRPSQAAEPAPGMPDAGNGPLTPFAGLKWPLIAKGVQEATGTYPKNRRHAEELMLGRPTTPA